MNLVVTQGGDSMRVVIRQDKSIVLRTTLEEPPVINFSKINILQVKQLQLEIIEDGKVIINLAYIQSKVAEAEALTSASFADEPIGINVKQYYYDIATDSILFNVTIFFSAFHWSEQAKLVSAGLEYLGNWDASVGTFPPDGDTSGQFYIVTVSGIINTEQFNVGDWIVWSEADEGGTDTYTGVHWASSWATIQDVLVEGVIPAIGDNLARVGSSYTKVEQNVIDSAQDQALADEIARATAQENLKLPLVGGTVTGQIKGVTPVAPEDLTRKDFVEQTVSIVASIGAVGTGVVSYGKFPPDGAIELKGQILDKTVFNKLYDFMGDIWNNVNGLPTPIAGYFRLPISFDSDGYGVYERGRTELVPTGTYQTDQVLSHSHGLTQMKKNGYSSEDARGYANSGADATITTDGYGGDENRPRSITVLKCMWLGILNRFRDFSNEDFSTNGTIISGFMFEQYWINDSFPTNVSVNIGFGLPTIFNNNDLVANANFILGFSNVLLVSNTDFQTSESFNNGFIY